MSLSDIKENIKEIFNLIGQGDKERAKINVKVEKHLTSHSVRWTVIKNLLWALGIISTILGVAYLIIK